MSVDMSKLLKLNALDAFAAKADAKIQAVEAKTDAAFKGVKVVNGNQIEFFTTSDTTTTAAFTVDLAAEMVVDATKTGFEDNFAFDSDTYVGATNPNLDGKAVFVMAVKSVDKGVTTTSYSFISVDKLVDIYTAGDNTIEINGYQVKVKISQAANNAITVKSDGLHVDISGKQDKDTDAVTGNVAKFDANGNAVDAGIAAANVLTTADIATDSDVAVALATYFN